MIVPIINQSSGVLTVGCIGVFFIEGRASFQSGFFKRKFGLQFKNFLRIRDSGFGKIKNRDFAYYDHYLQWLKS